MKKKKTNELVLEDVVYYEEKDGRCVSTAKDTFYHQYLMERANGSINGQNNLKAATDFESFEQLFVAMLNLGLLKDPRYCLDWTEIVGGACFSFNLGKALSELKLAEILENELQGSVSSDYIKTLVNPAASFRCSICGAVSLSRHISFVENGERFTYCLACHPLKDAPQRTIQKIYDIKGSLAAVKERIRMVEEACNVQIADGKTINMLLDEFIEENQTFDNPKVKTIEKIFKKAGRDEFQVFAYDEVGIVIINRERASDIKLFAEIAALNEDGSEIVALFDKAGVCWIDDKATEFAMRVERSIE